MQGRINGQKERKVPEVVQHQSSTTKEEVSSQPLLSALLDFLEPEKPSQLGKKKKRVGRQVKETCPHMLAALSLQKPQQCKLEDHNKCPCHLQKLPAKGSK